MAQTIEDAQFTVESRETARKVAANVQVSWKKAIDDSITFFTIGVSSIGGDDVIAGSQGTPSEWNQYIYEDETDNLLSIDYERGLNIPLGGLRKGLFNVVLDNTSDRYLPDYMGGSSALFTAQLPRRPVIINAGFNYNGIDNLLPQFVGISTEKPSINRRNKTTTIKGSDFLEFLQGRYLDETAMFTGKRSDEVISDALTTLGYSTSQYDLDTGINIIDFGIFKKGTTYASMFDKLAKAEYAHMYQDEEGVIRFENRMHWNSSPHTDIERTIFTADVFDAMSISDDHLINVVEVTAHPRVKESEEYLFVLQVPVLLEVGDNEFFVDYEDPVLEVEGQTFSANSNEFGTGADRTDDVTIKSQSDFAETTKYVLENNNAGLVWLTDFSVTGRPAKIKEEIYVRKQDDSSVTAFEEQSLKVENDFIQSQSWAESYAQMLLDDFAEPENLQQLRIRAMPELQLGDQISWQGKYWRIWDIATTIDPAVGFVQDIKLLKRTIVSYFQIGVSTIGSSDQIAP